VTFPLSSGSGEGGLFSHGEVCLGFLHGQAESGGAFRERVPPANFGIDHPLASGSRLLWGPQDFAEEPRHRPIPPVLQTQQRRWKSGGANSPPNRVRNLRALIARFSLWDLFQLRGRCSRWRPVITAAQAPKSEQFFKGSSVARWRRQGMGLEQPE